MVQNVDHIYNFAQRGKRGGGGRGGARFFTGNGGGGFLGLGYIISLLNR